MPHFVYVQARVSRTQPGPEAISFRSTVLEAESEDDAYTQGYLWGEQWGYDPGQFDINDLVVGLEDPYPYEQ